MSYAHPFCLNSYSGVLEEKEKCHLRYDQTQFYKFLWKMIELVVNSLEMDKPEFLSRFRWSASKA